MDHWTPQEWAFFLTAVAAFIGAISSTVSAFMASLAKLKGDSNGEKLDENTRITQHGAAAATATAAAATVSAAAATATAERTKAVAENINKKLNGGIDAAINQALAPVMATIEGNARIASDKVDELTQYMHKKHHDLVDSLGTLANRVNIIIAKHDEAKKQCP